ncbi:MAG TPA: type II secretion system protein N [Steroidobacteraceae bacterium]|nr:type II secretion system protein N [Steroidobacteraceae bacterium]
MKQHWPLLALGVGAFLILALVTLPASVVLSFVHPANVTLSGISGTIWNGRAQAVRSGTMHLGSVDWGLNVLSLFTGKLGADVKVARTDGFAQGSVAAGAGGITLRKFNASLPIGALPPNIVRGGWTGTLNLKLAELALDNAWPVTLSGTIEVADLVGPANRPAALGGYKVVFPEGAAKSDTLTGTLTDTGGPLAVNGTVQLKKDRSYLVSGLIATRPNAPSDMARTLEILGEPDAQGRRQFSIEGTM